MIYTGIDPVAPDNPRWQRIGGRPTLGSISTDTLKPRHLLVSFVDECRYRGIRLREYQEAHQVASSLDNLEYTEESISELVEELIETLNDDLPRGMYFGAHPGDGADFGYWKFQD